MSDIKNFTDLFEISYKDRVVTLDSAINTRSAVKVNSKIHKYSRRICADYLTMQSMNQQIEMLHALIEELQQKQEGTK